MEEVPIHSNCFVAGLLGSFAHALHRSALIGLMAHKITVH